jgi:putative ABC transport system permease protein
MLPRKVLVVVQFAVSVILIIGTVTIFHQIQYVKDRPVGYTREGLLMVSIQSSNVNDHLDIISQELKQTGLVREVSASQSDATNTWVNNMGFQWQGKDPALQESFTTNGVTPDFGKTTGWVITQGRDFSHLGTDSGLSMAAAADSASVPRESFTALVYHQRNGYKIYGSSSSHRGNRQMGRRRQVYYHRRG